MTFLTDAQQILPDSLVYALGWTVIHSLWQGTFIACLMALILTGLQQKSAEIRYRVAGGALFLAILVAVGTFCSLYFLGNPHTTGFLNETRQFTRIHFTFLAQKESFWRQNYTYISNFLNEHLFYIVIAWFLGVEFFTMRLIGGFWMVMKIRRSPKMALSEEWMDFVEMIREQMPFKQAVRIAESAVATVPMVVGWLKPLILLPIGTINNMSASQVEAIIAHELAHIAGKDYLFNALQTIAEVFFYYHPAIWWISAVIRAERENRCDDAAVKLCGNKMIYVKALVSMQELQKQLPKTNKTLGLALSFAGNRKYPLLERVKRVLNQSQNKSNIMEKMTATGLILAIVSLISISAKRVVANPNELKDKKPTFSVVSDTMPSGKVRQQIKRVDNGKTVEMTIENQQIMRLNIGGKEILKDDFVKHKALTDKLLADLPSVTDGKNGKVIALQKEVQMKVNKTKDDKGNTVIKIDKGDGKPIEMLVKNNEILVNGKKWVDGEEIVYDLPAGAMTEIMDMEEVKTIVKEAGQNGDKKVRKMMIIKDKEGGMDLEKMVENDPDLHKALDTMSSEGKKKVKIYRITTEETNIKDGDARLEAPKDGFGNVLRTHLTKDKLVEKGKFFKVELTNTQFLLDEREQPAVVFEKYKKLYLEHSGEKDCKNCKFKVVMELKN
jgi:beta-lactamase regulating signal transducer with metallopeptidase domain